MSRKGRGVLSYLLGWLGGLIVVYGMKDSDRKTVYHGCQAITIWIINVALSIGVSVCSSVVYSATGANISIFSGLVSILVIVLTIMGLAKVLNDDPDPKLPVVGDLTEKLFGKKINSTPEGATVPGVTPRFDPNTGQPVTPPQANFDPNTGQPITHPQANFDPNTGKPLNEATTPENNNQDDTI